MFRWVDGNKIRSIDQRDISHEIEIRHRTSERCANAQGINGGFEYGVGEESDHNAQNLWLITQKNNSKSKRNVADGPARGRSYATSTKYKRGDSSPYACEGIPIFLNINLPASKRASILSPLA